MNGTNEELLTDIANTEIERDAYAQISTGYRILAGIPDTTPRLKDEYTIATRKYWVLMQGCRDLLANLNKKRTERGI